MADLSSASPASPPPLGAALRALPRNVWILTLTSFFTDVSSDMLVNLVPLFLYNVLGVQTSLVGLIDGIAETTASITKVFSGALSDRIGSARGLPSWAIASLPISKPFLYFASSWGWVLGVRFSDRLEKASATLRVTPCFRRAWIPAAVAWPSASSVPGIRPGAFTGILIAAAIIWGTQQNASLLSRDTFRWVVLASILPAFAAVLVLLVGQKKLPCLPGEPPCPCSPLRVSTGVLSCTWPLRCCSHWEIRPTFLSSCAARKRGLSVLQVMGMLLATFMRSAPAWPDRWAYSQTGWVSAG